MYIQFDTIRKEADRLSGLVGKMNLLRDELGNIGIRLSEEEETSVYVPKLRQISDTMDLECEEIRKAVRCLIYISELCYRCNRRVGETLEEDPAYFDESYDWVENSVRKEAKITLEEIEES